jgi:hypothetical protein
MEERSGGEVIWEMCLKSNNIPVAVGLLAAIGPLGCHSSSIIGNTDASEDSHVDVPHDPDIENTDDGMADSDGFYCLADVKLECGQPSTATAYSMPFYLDDTALHFVGIYMVESTDHTEDDLEVFITNTVVPIVIAFNSYEPVNWIINYTPEVEIERIYISGYYDQRVTGVADALVEHVEGRPYHDFTWGEGRTALYVDEIEALSGLDTVSYNGCNDVTRVDISHVCND